MTVAEAELAVGPAGAAARWPAADTTAVATRPPVVAIVGRPNVGKSTFFARATGRFAETANAPGTTVAVAHRAIRLDGRPVELVDLPGTTSLIDRSDGLVSFWQLLLGVRPDAVLAVIDAGDLERHLPLVLACRDLGLPIVVAANLSDEARARGVESDLGRLAQLLAAPVIRTVGRTGEGMDRAIREAARLALAHRAGDPGARPRTSVVPPYPPDLVGSVRSIARGFTGQGPATTTEPDGLQAAVTAGRISAIGAATVVAATDLEPARWAVAQRWAREVERRHAVGPRLADRLSVLATAPWPGLPLFAIVTIASLLFTMTVGSWGAAVLAEAWGTLVSPVLTGLVEAVVPVPALGRASLWAIDSGLLAMLSVGLPFVLVFYLVLAVLEDSGYLATTTVLCDRILNALGLPGRATIPILAATACNVPAIYGTRVLESRRERLLASFLIVLTPCSARSAVIIAALAPFAGMEAALAAFGVVALIAIGAGLAANALVPGHQSPLVLELPRLRVPVARQVGAKAWYRFRSFVRTAAPVMLAGSLVLGLAYELDVLGGLEAALAPVTATALGLPPVVGIALVLGFLRKELALQLLLVLAIAEYGATAADLSTFMTTGQLFVFAVVTAVSFPCIATLASLADEFGWRSAAAITAAVVAVALLAGTILAQLVV
jgi:ferrous iron transport protein B